VKPLYIDFPDYTQTNILKSVLYFRPS